MKCPAQTREVRLGYHRHLAAPGQCPKTHRSQPRVSLVGKVPPCPHSCLLPARPWGTWHLVRASCHHNVPWVPQCGGSMTCGGSRDKGTMAYTALDSQLRTGHSWSSCCHHLGQSSCPSWQCLPPLALPRPCPLTHGHPVKWHKGSTTCLPRGSSNPKSWPQCFNVAVVTPGLGLASGTVKRGKERILMAIQALENSTQIILS